MSQFTLFDEDATSQSLQTVGIVGSVKTLTKAQKQFNKHIATIETLMRDIGQWQAFPPIFAQYVADHLSPLEAQLREKRIAMTWLLDRHLDGKSLSRGQRDKARDVLLNLLGWLIEEQESAELVQLHDKHSDVSFEECGQQDVELMKVLAEEVFGMEFDDTFSPEELMRQFHDEASGREEERRAKRAQQRGRKKKAGKVASQPVAQGTAVQDATRALRDIYRKLVSELHPDREQDPQRQAQLTDLMQQANLAYDKKDLLSLLKLQMQIEQVNPQVLAEIAQERLDSYNHVLREQIKGLQHELLLLKEPFALNAVLRNLTPQAVQKAIDADARELRTTLRELEEDLVAFEDVRQLKKWLKDYRIETPDDFDIDFDMWFRS